MKKLICAVISLLMIAGCISPAFAAQADSFVPVIRFVAASDSHVKEEDHTNEQRITKMLQLAYSIAGEDAAYSALDAVLVAGDLTNDGTKPEFDNFSNAVFGSLREGTKFLGVVAKNHDGYQMKREELRAYYKSVTGNNADFNTVINGYHFIGISASPDDAQHYTQAQIDWLEKQLAEATAEDPNKPVFVMHHEHNRGTVYGSSLYDGWGVTYFNYLLKKYPQVVDFSGHSHYPLNHPGSVWQGDFTAIGTGAIYYSEFTVEGERTYHPADSGDTATFWLVELDKDNNMRLRGYDINEGKELCRLMLNNPANPANRDYTPEKRKAASSAPAFSKDAALTVNPVTGGCKVTVPAARSTDGMPVVLYRIYAKNSMGMTVAKNWVMPSYYRAVEQDTIDLELSGLGAGEYTIGVVAENAYGMQSAPVEAKVTVESENTFQSFLDQIAQFFNLIKDFFIQLFW